VSSEWRDNLTNRIREICSSRRLPREAGERLWNTGSPVKYGRSGNLVWDWNLRALIYCSQSDALTIRPLRPQSTLCYRNSTCGWCCSLQFKAKGLDAVKRPILHHRTKFSIGLAVAEISRFFCDFQDGNRRHLGFSKIQYVGGQFVSPCQMSPKLVKRLLTRGDLKWRPPAILDLSGVYWDHPRRLLGGLYRCAKFGWNHCSTFDNMKVLIFCAFDL